MLDRSITLHDLTTSGYLREVCRPRAWFADVKALSTRPASKTGEYLVHPSQYGCHEYDAGRDMSLKYVCLVHPSALRSFARASRALLTL